MQKIKSFRELTTWQSSINLAQEIYTLTRSFPSWEKYGISSQMQRAAVLVASNIAEGHTRQYLKEYIQHLYIALGSLAELESLLEICWRLQYLSQEIYDTLLKNTCLLGKQTNALRNSLINCQYPTPDTRHPIPKSNQGGLM
jgi:four helix bundle protein